MTVLVQEVLSGIVVDDGGGTVLIDSADATILITESGTASSVIGDGSVEKVADVNVGGHRVVRSVDANRVAYADATNIAHRDIVLGITMNAASADEAVIIVTEGQIDEPTWTWTPLEPIWLGHSGLMTQAPDLSDAFIQTIGFAQSATRIFVRIGDAVTLS